MRPRLGTRALCNCCLPTLVVSERMAGSGAVNPLCGFPNLPLSTETRTPVLVQCSHASLQV
ncbi:hypothetical protein KC19_3G126300 [Ceratodon purpureus]|uniref:Uncharacterized protein n=1 Tax=Ceratodon purpureus TaxID=3225 RepID=A0A8T0IJV7_CERPU|nr:hypothetical protein KC19_3G126300 [Ceratodon purpureus]